jgi:hypothetical protein
MDLETLATYLNDHLAGSVGAIELLDHLRELSKGTERERLFTSLHSEIEEDQKVLRGLLRRQHDRVETERIKVARAAFGG